VTWIVDEVDNRGSRCRYLDKGSPGKPRLTHSLKRPATDGFESGDTTAWSGTQ
jgi:tetraacyldisaccharide-1-P 4'-kinase